ncbi:electron transfer flavoprotein subunit alpha/FixB family protein [Cellulomonas sp. C5510]|uniref:electron transfer flavoprotein subunit alpha/FixB family protein n=1 Tax=Cellulomonas sp. C5510 TaxID=2871170 RepID=UPI001C96DDD3|nr:electron transfer flavoprotein subunit alpha/FixB family protein [Cellulomonas sp. C5510]QZN86581.1 electron transfer flavoprotein subunit alpha/FixB family protein [Cellulomonas sp. C5510]
MTTCIVTTDPAVDRLLAIARTLGGPVVAVVAGARAVADAVAAGAPDRVVWLGEPGDAPASAFASAAADAVAAAGPAVVLAADRPADRVLAGAAAARLDAPALGGVTAVVPEGGSVLVTRTVLGGVATEDVRATGPVVLVTDGGDVPAPGAPAPVEEAPAVPAAVRVVETRPAATAGVDLRGARRVVSVGRGLKAREDVALVEALADALGAATACTRPLAEGVGFFPKDRYVGVSGRTVTPDLYLALGISGQVQHMVGARGSRTVVAVNTDAEAPIVAEADYAVVGDLYQVVPALTEALR